MVDRFSRTHDARLANRLVSNIVLESPTSRRNEHCIPDESEQCAPVQAPQRHFVYISHAGGGADTYVRGIARHLVNRGHRVTVLYLHEPGHVASGPTADGSINLRHAAIPHLHWYYHRMLLWLPQFMQNRLPEPSIVKVAEASWAMRLALRHIAEELGPIDLMELLEGAAHPRLFRRIAPYGVKLHSADFTWKYFCDEGLGWADQKRMQSERNLLRHARVVSSPSAALADHVAEFCDYPRSRITVISYPLDIHKFSPAPYDSHSTSDYRYSSSVLFVGRLVRRKGLVTLAQAAGAILDAVPDSTIDIIGGETGEIDASTLRSYVSDALHPRLIFHGRVSHEELPNFYRRAAICVVPSRWDNSPNTVYEAMGCGTPVVACRVGGIPDLVMDGETGLLVPRDDPDALATAAISLLLDRNRMDIMGQKARTQAVARFNPEMIVDQTLRLYEEALTR